MNLILKHTRGEMGPKTLDEWATPNGDDCLLIWMLRQIEDNDGKAELVATTEGPTPDYYAEARP